MVIARSKPAVRVICGTADDPSPIASAEAFAASIDADLQRDDAVGHALAEEPGIALAPQTDAARTYDTLAVGWFAQRLS